MAASNTRRIFQVIDGLRKSVGDGFDITSPMPGPRIRQLSPYLLIDHSGPTQVTPSDQQLGAHAHPHRGFETVTIVYSGFLEHRDSAGYSGIIGPGDVQWMTAGSGLLHEELHGKEFSKKGGTLELIQLWVNLPKQDKMTPPRYQELVSDQIPQQPTADGKGVVRVIAGAYASATGPAQTFSPMTLLDVKLEAGGQWELSLPAEYNVGVYVVKGSLQVNGQREAKTKQLVVFGWDAEKITLAANEKTCLLVLSGEPIEEPLATYGPFVMNSNRELVQAIADFESGKMGTLDR